MPLFRGCSNLVIRCFKRVEHFADWITGAAGPVFVFLAWVLIVSSGLVFFDTIPSSLPLPYLLLLSPTLLIVPLNLYGQYYLVTHVPSGFPSPRSLVKGDTTRASVAEGRWIKGRRGSVWSPERWGMVPRGGGRLSGLSGGGGAKGKGKMRESGNGGEMGMGMGTGYDDGAISTTSTRRVRRCRKCDAPKPERTHHCSVCKRCVLMMDHHCPWINACVGLHNQRHFILFMAWLCIACYVFALLGWDKLWASFGFEDNWNHFTPRIAYTLLYIIAVAIGLAVNVLLFWHLYLVSNGETSIESHDNAYLHNKASAEGLIYLNPYDLGRKRNLQRFFNIGSEQGTYPLRTLLFPLIVPPASDGWSYPRRPMPADGEGHVRKTAAPRHGHGHGHGHGYRDSKSENYAMEDAGAAIASGSGPGLGASTEAGLLGHRAEEGMGDGGRYLVLGEADELTDDEEGGGGWMEVEWQGGDGEGDR